MKKISTLTFLLLFISNIYAQQHSDFIGAGNNNGIQVSSSHNQNQTNPNNTVNGFGFMPDLAASSRFLAQSTFGTDMDYIENVQEQGISDWMDEQFNIPIEKSFLEQTIENSHFRLENYVDVLGEDLFYSEDFFYGIFDYQFRESFWQKLMTEDDYLRQRITFALSEILVVSSQSNLGETGFGLADYYDILNENAFGNYRDLLYEITMSPVMGVYLSHYNNPRSNPDLNIHPDENYAREIMQLFTIGLYELNDDGSRKTDNNGAYIPTYDNDDIRELAKVFTGLGAGEWTNFCEQSGIAQYVDCETYLDINFDIENTPTIFDLSFYACDMTEPMRMFEFWHEQGPKELLNGYTIPYGQTGMEDINDAIDHLFNHPNVGPFIGKKLIQLLVKSNPSPNYINRVTQAFNDNGQGVRGDMKSVIRAILLDPEARNCEWINDGTSGKMKEPFVRFTNLFRALNAQNDADYYLKSDYIENAILQQSVLGSPTVFNFFSPNYVPNSEFANQYLVAPEFQLHHSITSIDYVNLMEWCSYGPCYIVSTPFVFFDELNEIYLEENGEDLEMYYDLEDLNELAATPAELIEYLNIVLVQGNMTEATKNAIVPVMEQYVPLIEFDPNIEAAIVSLSIYFVMISPEYVILK